MFAESPQPSPNAARALLDKLVQEKGLRAGDYAFFFVTGEGGYLPANALGEALEELSGNVIDRDGRVFSFWLGWDPTQQRPALTRWEEERPEPHWAAVVEYRQARTLVGLSVP
jgi:hypothetical protein